MLAEPWSAQETEKSDQKGQKYKNHWFSLIWALLMSIIKKSNTIDHGSTIIIFIIVIIIIVIIIIIIIITLILILEKRFTESPLN